MSPFIPGLVYYKVGVKHFGFQNQIQKNITSS